MARNLKFKYIVCLLTTNIILSSPLSDVPIIATGGSHIASTITRWFGVTSVPQLRRELSPTTALAAIYMCWFLGYNTPQQMLNYFNVFQVGFAGLRQQPYLSTLFILEQKILTCSITVSSTIYWILKKRRGNAVSTERVYSDSWQCSAANNNIMFTMVAALLLQIIWT